MTTTTSYRVLLATTLAALALGAAGCTNAAAELDQAQQSIQSLHEQGRAAAQGVVNEMAAQTQGPTAAESSAETAEPTGPATTADGQVTEQTDRYAGLPDGPVVDITALSGPWPILAVGPDYLALEDLPGSDRGHMIPGLAGGPEHCAVSAWADMTAVTGNRPVWMEELPDGQIHFWTTDPATGAPDALIAAEMLGIGDVRLPPPGSPAALTPETNKYLAYLIGVQDKAMARADSCLWREAW